MLASSASEARRYAPDVTRFDYVFVLCTGRCGSTTLARACAHIDNYSSGHETRTHLVGVERLAYPQFHIEVDNRLSWFLGRLAKFDDSRTLYVHLTREQSETASSFLNRWGRGVIAAYADAILLGRAKTAPDLRVCFDYVDTVNANIEEFVRHRPHVESDRLESLAEDFVRLWDRIDAEGDQAAAIRELAKRHNRGFIQPDQSPLP